MKKLFYILVLAVSFTSCVKDTDYDTPQVVAENPTIPTNQLKTIASVIDKWNIANPSGTTSNVVEILSDEDDPAYISGYVVSNDMRGNFYKEIFIQDSLKNPQYAIKIAIEMTSLYTKYDLGRKVYVKLNGLAINRSHGEIVIGEYRNGSLENIRETKAKECILRNAKAETLIPTPILVTEIDNSLLGKYVELQDVQFELSEMDRPFVDPYDSYDSYRSMIDCNGEEIILETSTYATFKGQTVPSGKGSVIGIISRDYGDDFYVLRVNSPEDFSFDDERCSNLIFNDNFSKGFLKWRIYDNLGDQTWSIDTTHGNPGYCAKMSGYASGYYANEDWLISKPINLMGITNAKLNFQTARNYNGNTLGVLISTDYNGSGNPNDYTWTSLSATLSSTGFTWTDSGDISLSSFVGYENVYIAFKYTSGSSTAPTWEIDNVVVMKI